MKVVLSDEIVGRDGRDKKARVILIEHSRSLQQEVIKVCGNGGVHSSLRTLALCSARNSTYVVPRVHALSANRKKSVHTKGGKHKPCIPLTHIHTHAHTHTLTTLKINVLIVLIKIICAPLPVVPVDRTSNPPGAGIIIRSYQGTNFFKGAYDRTCIYLLVYNQQQSRPTIATY